MRQEPRAILYRILGNDLPPRHAPGQTLANLRYLLAHEPELPGLEKRWLLNRIVDPQGEAQLQEAIAAAGQRVDRLPFRPEEYRQVWCDIGATPADHHPWSETFAGLDPIAQARIVEYIARHRNGYVMNNNGARNEAIRLGLADAAWVFPWDGGCFLPGYVWEVLRPLTALEGLSYLVVPMQRLRAGEAPPAAPAVLAVQRDEPQLGFSRRARLPFDASLRYGSMPKAMLLRRIGLPGPWHDWHEGVLPWETPEQAPAADAGSYLQAGVVFRLSGEGQDERHVDLGALQTLRFESIRRFTRRLDQQSLQRFLAARPLRCWTLLAEDATPAQAAAGQAGLDAALEVELEAQLARQLEAARRLPAGPPRPGAGWGELPAAALCALALDLHRHGPAASQAPLRALVRGWFLGDGAGGAGQAEPLPLAPPGPAPCPETLAELRLLPALLDALCLARRAGALTPAELQGVESAVDGLFTWLCWDSGPFLRAHGTHPAATTYHLLMLAVACHLGRAAACAQVIDNLPGLLAIQFDPAGAPRTAAPLRQQLAHLQGWAELAVLLSCLGRDLLAMRDGAGHGLEPVLDHARRTLVPRLVDPADQAWWAWIERFLAPAAGAPGPLPGPPPAAAALPPFALLCRRLDPLPAEPPELAASPAGSQGR